MTVEKSGGALGAQSNSWEIQDVVKWAAVGLLTTAVISGFFGVSGLLMQAHLLPAGFAVINPGVVGAWSLTAISVSTFIGSCVGCVSTSLCLKKAIASEEKNSAIFEISGSKEPIPEPNKTPKKKKAGLDPEEKEAVKAAVQKTIQEAIIEGDSAYLWKVSAQINVNELIEVDDALSTLFNIEGKAHLYPLHIAALHRDKNLAEMLVVKVDANQTCFINGKEYTALDIALALEDSIIVETLLSYGADINRKGPNGQTPLLCVVTEGNAELVELLLGKGAQKAADEEEPLEVALENGNDEIAKLFISKEDVRESLSGYWTIVLQQAVEEERIEVVRHLFDCGYKWEWCKEASTIYPLHEAVLLQNKELIEFLIEKGIDVNTKITNQILGKDGDTPLHWCVRHEKNVDIALLLIQKRAELVAQNELGETPLHIAIGHKRSDLARLFMEKDPKAVKIPAKDKITPLHLCFSGDEPQLAIAKLLINHGANVNAKDVEGNTPLHLCYLNKMGEKAIKFLLTNHAKEKVYNKKNELPSQCKPVKIV